MDDQTARQGTDPMSDCEESVEQAGEESGEDSGEAGLNLGEIFSLLDTYKEITEEIKNDEKATFIKAIKPFLTEEQQKKAEQCLKVLALTRFMEHKEEFAKVGSKFLPT